MVHTSLRKHHTLLVNHMKEVWIGTRFIVGSGESLLHRVVDASHCCVSCAHMVFTVVDVNVTGRYPTQQAFFNEEVM